MPVPITAFYAAILVFIGIWLAIQVGRKRAATGISILHGDDMAFAATIRRHDNFTENVPLVLVLLTLLELSGSSALLLHGLGTVLVLSRIAHPLGLRHDDIRHPLRAIGAAGTVLVSVVAAVMLLWQFFAG